MLKIVKNVERFITWLDMILERLRMMMRCRRIHTQEADFERDMMANFIVMTSTRSGCGGGEKNCWNVELADITHKAAKLDSKINE